mmetsp:Transcript_22144/g.10529  ORF Transcript_22144/g.10529 Transcript_22144/m.10529 type:complete len:270 (+) Transcript_22144:247-1056(+)
MSALHDLIIGIKGAGEMASAIAWRLYMSNIKKLFMLDIDTPSAVRSEVCFCEAIYKKSKIVEGVEAVKANDIEQIHSLWDKERIAVVIDPTWKIIYKIHPDVVIDAVLAKKNLGTQKEDAALVIALGPGFYAGNDVHMVIETNRGHNLGKIFTSGSAEPNTGIPGRIRGHATKRVLRTFEKGVFITQKSIGDYVKKEEVIGTINKSIVKAEIDGMLRGLIRPGTKVSRCMKLGDIDPRSNAGYCYTISDKARAISGSVLEAILRIFNSS